MAGTFANCAGGVTPWGTVLSGEENFNSYFGAPEGAPPPNPVDADRFDRYGIALEPGELKWEPFDPRFDVAKTPNEVNRFGYVIEVNPWDPSSTPVKHSALGRLKHEGANVYITDDGTVVVYTGDDERFDYMYKFVSSKKMQPGRDRNDGEQYDAARRGHAVCGQVVQRYPRRRDRRLGRAAVKGLVQRHRDVDSAAPVRPHRPGRISGGRHHAAGGGGVHPVRGGQGRRHKDGSARRLRGQPEDRQGLRRADQQRRARRARRRAPTRPTRAPTTRAGRSWRSPTSTRGPTSRGSC